MIKVTQMGYSSYRLSHSKMEVFVFNELELSLVEKQMVIMILLHGVGIYACYTC